MSAPVAPSRCTAAHCYLFDSCLRNTNARKQLFLWVFLSHPLAAAHRSARNLASLARIGWAARWRGGFIPCTSPYTGRPTPPPARHHVHPVPLQPLLLPAVRRAQPMRHGRRPPARKLLVHDPTHRTCRPGRRARGTARQGLHLPGLRHALQQHPATLCTPTGACVDMISAFCGDTP